MSNWLPYTDNENNFWSFYTDSNRLTEKVTDWRTSNYVEYSLQMLLGQKKYRGLKKHNKYRLFPGGRERPGRDAERSPPSSAVVIKE
jgi:hypothetical protein